MDPKALRSLLILLALFLALVFSGDLLRLYIDSLWFREVGFLPVFAKILFSRIGLGAAQGLVFFAALYPNLRAAARYRPGGGWSPWPDLQELPIPVLGRLVLIASAIIAVVSGMRGSALWEKALLFSNAVPFNRKDPLFGIDLGYYVFRLPLWSSIQGTLFGLTIFTIVATFGLYLYRHGIRITARGVVVESQPRIHLILLIAAAFFLLAWGYRIDQYELLYSQRGAVFGAVYADIYGRLPILRLQFFVAVSGGLVLAVVAFRRGLLFPLGAVVGVYLVGALAGGIYPDLLHRFKVVPNEIAVETPYIQRNIQHTRYAFGLNQIESREFPAETSLSSADLQRNRQTTDNVRLWDHRPLLVTYRQLQQIRTYYDFVDVDNDRYWINGEYRQVMISPRELSYRNLPSRNWINEHLTFTHGFGVILGPVSRISREGLPEFFIRDIPPVSTTDMAVKRPEVYYGEIPNEYVFVRTRALELDYPSGEKNVYAAYQGSGGVPVRSFLRTLAFAAYFRSMKILLTDSITPDSRVMFHREVRERVERVTPFLRYDDDPYLVITREGRLVWILDGYTTTDRIPYSQPLREVGNYIRNAVKATVDAYDGSLRFYISDPEDPLIRAYARIFPGVFRPLAEMPEDLRTHLRYPPGMFRIQAQLYATYHMQEPQILYNREDMWNIPQKGGRDMEPYYTIMKLPGESKEEFILMIPYTPARRDNLSAWLAARSDGEHYGKLVAFVFPKQKVVFGPRQIESRIDQDPFISQQLTLWGQRGSEVIRGSLMVIPIEQSLLYVEPLYLAASEAGSLPELRRVIVAYGNRLVMEPNLEAALQTLMAEAGTTAGRPEAQVAGAPGLRPVEPKASNRDESRKAAQALEEFQRAQSFLREGRWAEYGEAIRQLERTLHELSQGAPSGARR